MPLQKLASFINDSFTDFPNGLISPPNLIADCGLRIAD
jgi:hypothetical protein